MKRLQEKSTKKIRSALIFLGLLFYAYRYRSNDQAKLPPKKWRQSGKKEL
jgi:hypothetical protein